MQTEPKRHRVVLLCNPSLHTTASAVALIRADVDLVGILAAYDRAGFERVRRSIRRNGLSACLSRSLSRTLCRMLNGRRDRRVYDKFYDANEIEESIRAAQVPVKFCGRYEEQDAMDWIRSLAPEILVVHSGTMVSRSVRDLARTGLVIGGHPGLTQFFRGGNSSFRAVYQGRPDDVGWTVFHLDKGVDTGDVITQGRLELQPEDSFETLDWRAMLCIAEEQARLISQLDRGHPIPRRPYGQVDAGTLYWYPTLLELVRYRLRQRTVR